MAAGSKRRKWRLEKEAMQGWIESETQRPAKGRHEKPTGAQRDVEQGQVGTKTPPRRARE